jgi:hypothetical protein
MEPWESWRAKLLYHKLLYRGHRPLLRREPRHGHWQVVLPVAADGREAHYLHFGPMRHDKGIELRTIQLRDVTGAVRTVRLQDLSDKLASVTVCDVDGQERRFRIAVLPGEARTLLERDIARVRSILALHEWSWLLSGWDRLHQLNQTSARHRRGQANTLATAGANLAGSHRSAL